MNGLKIEGLNKVDVIEAPVANVELEETKENTSEDMLESTQPSTETETEQPKADEEQPKAESKHVIKYVGNGEYIDSIGHKWHNGHEQIMSDEEYEERVDLQFMVKYGAMTNTVVA